MNRNDIKTEILVRSGKTTNSAWLSDTFLDNWINQSHRWASGFKPWPFTEGSQSTTYTATSERWDFEGYKIDSIRILQIGDDLFEKLNFEDYKIFQKEQPGSNDKVFTDFGRQLYINPKCGCSGTLTIWGQYQPADMPVGDGGDADDTVFSGVGDEGNEAIIERSLAYVMARDNKEQSMQHYAQANLILDILWRRIADEQFKYMTKDRGMWKHVDVLNGNIEGYTNSDQF